MPVRMISVGDAQQPLTLNMLIAAPEIIVERFLEIGPTQFVMEQVLRNAGPAPGGAVQYRISSGIFTDQSSEIVNERAEIPLVTVTKGDLQTAVTRPGAFGIAFSYEQMEMDITGEVNWQLRLGKNTMVRDFDLRFFNALNSAVTQTVAAAFPWANASATIRKNINAARLLIQTAQAPGAAANSYLQFQPDTLIVHPNTQADLLNSTEFIQMIYGQVQPSAGIDSLSQVPGGQILGLKPLVTFSCPVGTAYIVESKTIGGWVDRQPLQVTDLYDWPPSRVMRSDFYRDSAPFIDQPLAGAKLTGI